MPKGVYERSAAEKQRLTQQIVSQRGTTRRKTGKVIPCKACGKEKYFQHYRVENLQDHFCSNRCTIAYYKKGKPTPLAVRQKMRESQRHAGDHWNWKGGKFFKSSGYVLALSPDHPFADSRGYVLEHRLIMEQHLGRFLDPSEVVHHNDHDRANNDISNLTLFASHGEHMRSEHQHPPTN